ncbi:hypothetical protein EDD15DRAFT_2198264 [Pisolithus albus]|nr:hypothetical protein EDD15DRAFT_2198264 [Pisolithus albus]
MDTTSTGKMRDEQLATIEIALVLKRSAVKVSCLRTRTKPLLTRQRPWEKLKTTVATISILPRKYMAPSGCPYRLTHVNVVYGYSLDAALRLTHAEKLQSRRWIPSASQSPITVQNTTLKDILTSNGVTIKIQMDLHTDAWRLFHRSLVSPR